MEYNDGGTWKPAAALQTTTETGEEVSYTHAMKADGTTYITVDVTVTYANAISGGKTALYISHRLEEVQRICDRATVLRHGKVTGACDPRKETPASIGNAMRRRRSRPGPGSS